MLKVCAPCDARTRVVTEAVLEQAVVYGEAIVEPVSPWGQRSAVLGAVRWKLARKATVASLMRGLAGAPAWMEERMDGVAVNPLKDAHGRRTGVCVVSEYHFDVSIVGNIELSEVVERYEWRQTGYEWGKVKELDGTSLYRMRDVARAAREAVEDRKMAAASVDRLAPRSARKRKLQASGWEDRHARRRRGSQSFVVRCEGVALCNDI